MIRVENICRNVLTRMHAMDYEKNCDNSCEKLVFPNKVQARGNIRRISEQELRLLFIEELKASNLDLFYSIETPTQEKYKFGESLAEITHNKNGQSALLDMCVFTHGAKEYQRILNIEFKHKNSPIRSIGKDILKLICETQNGAFIQLLDNTNNGTLHNKKDTGVLDKLYKSFLYYKGSWSNSSKNVCIIVLSLKEQILVYRAICSSDLNNIDSIFFRSGNCVKMRDLNGKENWRTL
jgi:hypothetical protein